MSVTFWIPDAPRTRLMVACTSEIYSGDPTSGGTGNMEACKPGKACGYCQDGMEETWESPAPELNIANETARLLLLALNLPYMPFHDLYGSIEPKQIPSVRRSIVRALSTGVPEREAVPGFESNVARQAHVISYGVSPERIRDRLMRLDAVLVYAQKHGQKVTWG